MSDDESNDAILRFVQPLVQCMECKQFYERIPEQELPGLKVSSNSKNFHSIPGCILGMGERRVKASMMVIWHGSKNAQIVSAAEIYTHFPEMIKAYHDRIDQEKNGGVLR